MGFWRQDTPCATGDEDPTAAGRRSMYKLSPVACCHGLPWKGRL